MPQGSAQPRPPALPNHVFRLRLLKRLDDAAERTLVAIVGGAGSGKTTLLGQWAAGHRVAWYTATSGDTIATALQAIVAGLSEHLGEPDRMLSLALDASAASHVETDPARADALAAALCGHVAGLIDGNVENDVTLIVDDCHELDDGVGELIAALVRHAPPFFHVVVSSRRELPFPTARLILTGQADEILGAELAFTADEAVLLLDDGPAADTTAADLVARTGGWVLATVFAARTGRAAAAGLGGGPATDIDPFVHYIAEEVARTEPTEVIAALRIVARLPWVTPALADHLELQPCLTSIRRTSILLVPSGERPDAVTIAPLVRAAILEEDLGGGVDDAGRLRDVMARAAQWFAAEGATSAALHCLVGTAERGPLADFLRAHGPAMIAAGRAANVDDAVAHLGDDGLDVTLTLVAAEARQALGKWDDATLLYERLVPAAGPIPAGVAWRLGLLHYTRGDSRGAAEVFARGSLDAGELADEAALLAWHAATHWRRGDRDEARALAGEALSRATAAGDARSMATAYTTLAMVAAVDGDRAANLNFSGSALEHAERAGDLQQIVRIRCNRGSHFIEHGRYVAALAELDAAIRLADLGGHALWRGLSVSNRAEGLVAVGRLDEALADIDEARTVFSRIDSRLEAYPLVHLGELHAARGETARARAAFEHAILLASEPVDPQALVPALAGLALVRMDEDPVAALALAEQAVSIENAVAYPRAVVVRGWVSLASGDKEEAVSAAERAAGLARARDDRPSLAYALELAAAAEPDPERCSNLLDEARGLWIELGVPLGVARVDLALAELRSGSEAMALADAAAAAFDALGARRFARRARARAAALRDGTTDGIRVQVLGGFSLVIDGVTVPPSAWQSRVARDLFKILVVNRGRPLHRDVLIHRLWPEDDSDKAKNRLSVALTTVRNVLDPGRQVAPDSAIVADRETVAINPDRVDVDVDLFLTDEANGRALIARGEREAGVALLRLAESRYAGDVLEDEPYADWAMPLREEAAAMYKSLVAELAAADSDVGDHDAAARRCLRLLDRNPYFETAHLGAVRALRAGGHHFQARRLYANYVAKMREIDVEPVTYPSS